MIAELYGKISRNGSNLSDRSEDNLTGNFFGSMRYFSFNKVLKKILLKGNNANFIQNLDLECIDNNLKFWPSRRLNNVRVEPDLILYASGYIIGIEVKLYSGLSQNENEDNESDEAFISSEQLIKEAHVIINDAKANNKTPALIFVAAEGMGASIYSLYKNKMPSQIIFSFISWQQILEELKEIKKIESFSRYENVLLQDLIELLEYKGFDRFEKIYTENNQLIEKDLYYEFK